MNQSGSIESVKRSDTAELRRRYDVITKLLADGYNHKQICEHLNQEGLAIPYRNYRAIMTRLRREKSKGPSDVSKPFKVGVAHSAPVARPPVEVAGTTSTDADEADSPVKKFSWNPGSEVQWK